MRKQSLYRGYSRYKREQAEVRKKKVTILKTLLEGDEVDLTLLNLYSNTVFVDQKGGIYAYRNNGKSSEYYESEEEFMKKIGRYFRSVLFMSIREEET